MDSTRAPSGAALLRPAVTDAIVEATVAELAEKGYARASMEGVAKRAGVGKSAIYRRWGSKPEMVADIIALFSVQQGEPPDTGSFRGDVAAVVADVAEWFADERTAAVMPDLVAESRRDADLAEAVVRHIRKPRRTWARQIFSRRDHHSQLSPADAELLLDAVVGTFFWRISQNVPVTKRDKERLVQLLVDGFGGGRS